MDPQDKVLSAGSERLQKAFGSGAAAIPWQTIIAILMQLLQNCPTPAPPALRAGFARPLVRLKIMRQLQGAGIKGMEATRVLDACEAALKTTSDEELTALVGIAHETA